MPFFRDVAIGCYVRVGIGAHEGRMVYRVSVHVYLCVLEAADSRHVACIHVLHVHDM